MISSLRVSSAEETLARAAAAQCAATAQRRCKGTCADTGEACRSSRRRTSEPSALSVMLLRARSFSRFRNLACQSSHASRSASRASSKTATSSEVVSNWRVLRPVSVSVAVSVAGFRRKKLLSLANPSPTQASPARKVEFTNVSAVTASIHARLSLRTCSPVLYECACMPDSAVNVLIADRKNGDRAPPRAHRRAASRRDRSIRRSLHGRANSLCVAASSPGSNDRDGAR